MSNKKRSLLIVSVALMLALNGGISLLIVKSMNKTKTVLVAKETLIPRKPIEETDLVSVDLPSHLIPLNIYTEKEEIIGKVVAYHASVYEGMFFFKDALDEPTSSKDAPLLRLKENQIAISFGVDVLSSIGNSLLPGQYVDISMAYVVTKSHTIVDTIFSDVRILAIKDKFGIDMDDPKSQKVPHVVLLALNHDDVNDFHLANRKGKLALVPLLHHEIMDDEALKNESSPLWDYLYE